MPARKYEPQARRRKMRMNGDTHYVMLRVPTRTYEALHQRAYENRRSVNYDLNELISSALESEVQKADHSA